MADLRAHCRSDRHGSQFAGAVRLDAAGNLGLAYYWDEAKRNHGHGSERVYRTIPEFRRNPCGVYVDATSKLLRAAEGRPERSGFDSRAAIVGYRLPRDTDAVPVLSPSDVWRLAYPATDSDLDRRRIARDRGKVVRQLRKPEEAGRIELVKDRRGGLQTFESDPTGKP